MMIAVMIISISVGLAAPGIMRAMAQRRAVEATQRLVRLGARARAAAMAFGRAHALHFDPASVDPDGTMGRVDLWRGTLSRCGLNAWTTLVAPGCDSSSAATRDTCIGSLNMSEYDYGDSSSQVRLALPGSTDDAYVCFQPNGDVLYSEDGTIWTQTPPAGSHAVRFTIDQLESGVNVGVQRAVIFPFGTAPRIVR